MRTTRRGLLQGVAALAGVAVCGRKLHGIAETLREVGARDRALLSRPVHVPEHFVGMHAHRWPIGTPASPVPTYGFGAARSHDYDGAAWYSIHKAPGVFDWSKLDAWVEAHSAAGRTTIYTLYGTPAWAASSTAQRDPYGEPGGATPPRNLDHVAEFIHELMSRYNAGKVRKLTFLELWNEPGFSHEPRDFWGGTAAELASLGRTVALSAKRVDPGVRILSPGFNGNLAGALSLASPTLRDAASSPMYQFLTAQDGCAGTGAKWCDGIAFHSYNVPLAGANTGFAVEIARLKEMLHLMAVAVPLHNTEFGFLEDDPFHRIAPRAQGLALKRCAAIQAALGVQAMCLYSHDDDLIGCPALHPEVAEAIGELHASMAGKTLQQVTMLRDGSVEVATTERTFLW